MRVPSISDLTRAFGQEPVSVAEVGVGRFLPLGSWPEGEVMVSASIAGRSVQLCICPNAGRVRVEILSPDPLVDVAFGNIESVDVISSTAAYRGIALTRVVDGGGTETIEIRTSPEIGLRSN